MPRPQWMSPATAIFRVYGVPTPPVKRVQLVKELKAAGQTGRLLELGISVEALETGSHCLQIRMGFDTEQELNRLVALINQGFRFGFPQSRRCDLTKHFHASRAPSWQVERAASRPYPAVPAKPGPQPSRVLRISGYVGSSMINEIALRRFLAEKQIDAEIECVRGRYVKSSHPAVRPKRIINLDFCDWATEARHAFLALKELRQISVSYGVDACERCRPTSEDAPKLDIPGAGRASREGAKSNAGAKRGALSKPSTQSHDRVTDAEVKSGAKSDSVNSVQPGHNARPVISFPYSGKTHSDDEAQYRHIRKVDVETLPDAGAQLGHPGAQHLVNVVPLEEIESKEQIKKTGPPDAKTHVEGQHDPVHEVLSEEVQLQEKIEKVMADERSAEGRRKRFANPDLDSWVLAMEGDERRQTEERLLLHRRAAHRAPRPALLPLEANPCPARILQDPIPGSSTKSEPDTDTALKLSSAARTGPQTSMMAVGLGVASSTSLVGTASNAQSSVAVSSPSLAVVVVPDSSSTAAP